MVVGVDRWKLVTTFLGRLILSIVSDGISRFYNGGKRRVNSQNRKEKKDAVARRLTPGNHKNRNTVELSKDARCLWFFFFPGKEANTTGQARHCGIPSTLFFFLMQIRQPAQERTLVCSRHLPFLSSFGSLFFLPRKRQCRHTERDSILCYMTLPQFFLSLSLTHTHCPLACRIALFFLHCHFAPFFRCRPILCLVPSWLSVIQSTVVHQHVTQTFCSAQPLQKPYCRDNVYVQQNGAAALHYDCIAGGAVRTEVGRQGPHAVRSFACSLLP